MALTKANSGKYLTKEYARLLEKASIDRTQMSQEELDWLEFPADQGLGEFNPDNFKIDSQPLDQGSPSGGRPSKRYDIRTRDGCREGDE